MAVQRCQVVDNDARPPLPPSLYPPHYETCPTTSWPARPSRIWILWLVYITWMSTASVNIHEIDKRFEKCLFFLNCRSRVQTLRSQNGRPCSHKVPPKVQSHIIENNEWNETVQFRFKFWNCSKLFAYLISMKLVKSSQGGKKLTNKSCSGGNWLGCVARQKVTSLSYRRNSLTNRHRVGRYFKKFTMIRFLNRVRLTSPSGKRRKRALSYIVRSYCSVHFDRSELKNKWKLLRNFCIKWLRLRKHLEIE